MELKGSAASDSCGSYDEVFDDRGCPRPPYVEFGRRLGFDVLRPPPGMVQQLRDRPLGDDCRILPVPWVIDEREIESVVRHGTAQRARALQMFFADIVLGDAGFVSAALGLGWAELHSILHCEGTSQQDLQQLWEGHTQEEITFVYGPDLVRDGDGAWLVLEDNVGCVGGVADSYFVLSKYLAASGAPGASALAGEPDLKAAVARWLRHCGRGVEGGGATVVLGCEAEPGDLRSLLVAENSRRCHILAPLGLTVASDCSLDVEPLGSAPGLGRPIVNFHAQQGPLYDAFQRRHRLLNGPGTGLLGNKALLPHVDEMVRFYCGEEPAVPTAPTIAISGKSSSALAAGWVVKSTTGCQGTEVYSLHAEQPARLERARELVSRSGSEAAYVAQRRIRPSHLASEPGAWCTHLLELRPLSYVVGWSDILIGGHLLGKAISAFDLRGRNNVSQGACYVAVASIPDPAWWVNRPPLGSGRPRGRLSMDGGERGLPCAPW